MSRFTFENHRNWKIILFIKIDRIFIIKLSVVLGTFPIRNLSAYNYCLKKL